MDQGLSDRFSALPPLAAETRSRPCKICGTGSRLFDVVDFNKFCSDLEPYYFGRSGIAVEYLRCDNCGLIFTELFDDWTKDDFSRFIYNEDYIKVDGDYVAVRPMHDAERVARLLAGHEQMTLLDYGGGAGVLARTLRERGFDAETFDPFASPERPDRRFDILTSFEVIEHSPTPIETMRDMADMLNPGGCIVFGTAIQPPEIDRLRASWWYIGPRNGHVTIHSLESLVALAASAGMILHHGPGFTAFAAPEPSPDSARLLAAHGRPYFLVDLFAPGDGCGDILATDGWHGPEGQSRWSGRSELTWRLNMPVTGPCSIQCRILCDNEIQPGFADASYLAIGAATGALVRKGRYLVATIDADPADGATVQLVTPPPLVPDVLYGNGDGRALGLAVRTAPGVGAFVANVA